MRDGRSDDFWTRPHPEAVVLDVGGDVGALVLYVPEAYRGREIELSRAGDDGARTHTAVLERLAGGRSVLAAVYPALGSGTWRLRGDPGQAGPTEVTIEGGAVSEVDWRP